MAVVSSCLKAFQSTMHYAACSLPHSATAGKQARTPDETSPCALRPRDFWFSKSQQKTPRWLPQPQRAGLRAGEMLLAWLDVVHPTLSSHQLGKFPFAISH